MSAKAKFAPVRQDRDERAAFTAAALACGFGPAEATPGVSRMMEADRDPDDPGSLSFYFGLTNPAGGELKVLTQVWQDQETQDEILREVSALPARIISARTAEDRMVAAKKVEDLTTLTAFCYMRLFWLRRAFVGQIVGPETTEQERRAAAALDKIPGRISASAENMQRIARDLNAAFVPAMAAWVKCWLSHYRSQGGALEVVGIRTSLRFDRGEMQYPLLIPFLRDENQTRKLIERWT